MSIIQHEEAPVTATLPTTDRTIPPMSFPRRVRAAAHLAWQTLRTGQYLPAVHYMQGSRDGMDTAMRIVSKTLTERASLSEGGAR